MTLVIAHRGASLAEPENTVAAFRRAGDRWAPTASSSTCAARPTTGSSCITTRVLADGRAIRRRPPASSPTTCPTLATALDACAGMFVNVEIKNDPTEPDFDPADWVAHQVAAELTRRGGGVALADLVVPAETVAMCRTRRSRRSARRG